MRILIFVSEKAMGANTTNFAVPDASWKAAETNPPKAGTLVKYRTASYQMLGYVTFNGHWVATDGVEELQPVKAWKEVGAAVSASNWPERVA
jgi:hypothetical protein